MDDSPKYRHGGPVPDETLSTDDSATEDGTTTESIFEDLPILGGFVAGSAAYAITLLFVVAAAFGARRSAVDGQAEEYPHFLLEAVWSVYLTFGVEIRHGEEPIPATELMINWSWISLAASPVFVIGIFGTILVAGYAAAQYADTDSALRATIASMLVIVPYLVMAPVFATLATWTTPDGGSVTLSTTGAVVYGGLLWPAAFAIAGGLLAVGRDRWVTKRDRYKRAEESSVATDRAETNGQSAE